ncbi:Proline--tRNA ligase [Defluviimonas aquaemixtae]|uniref:Proline--tRNA ligase n=1 Tax=Albidovulum aquaemixtae TaxID=1542388 RepID=A0A2R8BNL0_9RHOB|nr:YbaK/EbsC family protein [Defluviimonas aquaemixtae]SPH25006.1 Proline--tRNA ligase [Defluviimonas aquaemixtae]
MTIAKRLKSHLESQGVSYETVSHPRTATASETAEAAHIPGDRLAKSVAIHLEDGHVLAVVPSSHRVDLSALQGLLDRRLGLASETEVKEIFDDCDVGAAPPVGAAYGVPVVMDESLRGLDRVWFEGGDHRTLVSVAGADFDRLMKEARTGAFGHRT